MPAGGDTTTVSANTIPTTALVENDPTTAITTANVHPGAIATPNSSTVAGLATNPSPIAAPTADVSLTATATPNVPSDASPTTNVIPIPVPPVGEDCPPHARVRAAWSAREKAVLKPFIDKFKAGDKERRKYLLQHEIFPAFWELHPDVTGDKRDKMKSAVKRWFSNTGRRTAGIGRYKLAKTKWTDKRVLAHTQKKAIEDIVRARSNLKPGDPGYLGCYQKGLSQLYDTLTDEKKAELKAIGEGWENEGYPPDIQAKTAATRGHAICLEMDTMRYRHMGYRAITYEGHKDSAGELGIGWHDFNDRFGKKVLTFPEKFPEEHAAFIQVFLKYLRYVEEIQSGKTVKTSPVKKAAKPAMKLETSADGFPLLPAPAAGGTTGGPDTTSDIHHIRALFRAYLTAHYAMATGSKTKAVPWKLMGDNNEQWIEQQYRPVGLKLCEPSNMNKESMTAALDFWYARQSRVNVGPSRAFRWQIVSSGRTESHGIKDAPYPTLKAVKKPGKKKTKTKKSKAPKTGQTPDDAADESEADGADEPGKIDLDLLLRMDSSPDMDPVIDPVLQGATHLSGPLRQQVTASQVPVATAASCAPQAAGVPCPITAAPVLRAAAANNNVTTDGGTNVHTAANSNIATAATSTPPTAATDVLNTTNSHTAAPSHTVPDITNAPPRTTLGFHFPDEGAVAKELTARSQDKTVMPSTTGRTHVHGTGVIPPSTGVDTVKKPSTKGKKRKAPATNPGTTDSTAGGTADDIQAEKPGRQNPRPRPRPVQSSGQPLTPEEEDNAFIMNRGNANQKRAREETSAENKTAAEHALGRGKRMKIATDKSKGV